MSLNLRIHPKIYFIITLFTILIHTTTLDALKCVCNVADCDIVNAEDCPGRGLLVWDPCRWEKKCFKKIFHVLFGLIYETVSQTEKFWENARFCGSFVCERWIYDFGGEKNYLWNDNLKWGDGEKGQSEEKI